jgi:nickel-dependent lactate racemase
LRWNHPTGSAPLASVIKLGETVAILVNDITRLARSDLFLPPIVDTLNRAGIPDADIFIMFALGTHRAQTEKKQRSIVGEGISRRIRMYDHDGNDDANLVLVGTTKLWEPGGSEPPRNASRPHRPHRRDYLS